MAKYKVGQTIAVKLSGGRIVEAEIKAIIETTDGLRLNVGFGSEAALIYEWQIIVELQWNSRARKRPAIPETKGAVLPRSSPRERLLLEAL